MAIATTAISRLQDALDANLHPGPNTDQFPIIWDNAAGLFLLAQSLTGGGGGAFFDVTYADLVALIQAEELVPGALYRISDFATVHYIIDPDAEYNFPDQPVTGPTEPLIVQALGLATLGSSAISETYPADIIRYDWNPANWIGDPAFYDVTDTNALIPDFRGVITYRHDTLQNNSACFDFRNCRFRRFKLDVPTWSNATAYSAYDFVRHSGVLYRAVQDGTNKTPISNPKYWAHLLSLSTTPYCHYSENAFHGQLESINWEYQDFPVFAGAYSTCSGNHLPATRRASNLWRYPTLANVVFLGNNVRDNQYGAGFAHNTFGPTIIGNTFGAGFAFNLVSNIFQNNIVAANAQYNLFGTYFADNIIGANFAENMIGQSCSGNRFGENSAGNLFANSFTRNNCGVLSVTLTTGQIFSNTFLVGHSELVLPHGFKFNLVYPGASEGADFDLGPHLVTETHCEIMFNEDGLPYYRYIDGDGNLAIVPLYE